MKRKIAAYKLLFTLWRKGLLKHTTYLRIGDTVYKNKLV